MSADIVARLKAPKLHGMAANWPEVLAHCRHAALEPERLVEQLPDAEGAERNVRSIACQMGAARFPAHRDPAGFCDAARRAPMLKLSARLRRRVPTETSSARTWRSATTRRFRKSSVARSLAPS